MLYEENSKHQYTVQPKKRGRQKGLGESSKYGQKEIQIIQHTMDTVVETSSPEKLENGHLSWGSEAIGSDEVLDYLETASVDLNEVKIGVIDSGIDYNHEFLKDRMIDEGLNFSASGDDTAMSDDPDSHGTHVSGIIVDNTPESVKIKGYKIFDSEGETTDLAIVSAVDKAVADGMDILNLSFGGGTSETVKESFLNAYYNGVALVSAAGNDSLNIDNILPSCLKESITVAKLQNVLSVDVSGKLSYEQNIVDEQTRAILNAISALELKSADYSELDKVLETIPDDLSIYTDESLAELNDILDSIDKNLDITNQSQIDEWAKQVETAVQKLKIKPADYTVLDEVISKIPDNLSIYTDESVKELEKVLNNIDRELDITQQEQVDNYVTTVEQAITKLNYKPADYSLVFDAIATIPNDLSIYTPESVEALESIIEGVNYNLDITQQEKVDEYAEQIKQAVEELEEECWLVRLFRMIVSFFKNIFLCLENCIFNIFDC